MPKRPKKPRAIRAPKKPGPKPSGATPWQPLFLKALANSANVRAACQAADVEPSTAYDERRKDRDFRRAWKAALRQACDILKAHAWKRATEGTTREDPMLYKGKIVAFKRVTDYSDTLLIFLMKAHDPAMYRDRYEVKHKGRIKHDLTDLPDSELERIIREESKI